jgi:3-oxoacyl-[acyl-carrier protein] reductase
LTEEVLALGPAVAGEAEYVAAQRPRAGDPAPLARALDCVEWLLSPRSDGISGRLLAAPWDPWTNLRATDLTDTETYTLRRVVPPGA